MGPLIASHAAAAFAAIGIGAAQLVARKGTRGRRLLGYSWVLLPGFVALGSFGIHTIRTWGPFSRAIARDLGLAGAGGGLRPRGEDQGARQTMLGVFAMALVPTGLFTMLPGRVMHAAVFGH